MSNMTEKQKKHYRTLTLQKMKARLATIKDEEAGVTRSITLFNLYGKMREDWMPREFYEVYRGALCFMPMKKRKKDTAWYDIKDKKIREEMIDKLFAMEKGLYKPTRNEYLRFLKHRIIDRM